MKSSFFIALRYLWGRAGEGGRYLRGAAASIALSLVPIIVTLIVADGMIRGITDRYLELGTGHLEVYDYIGAGDFSPELQENILALDGVRGAWRERQGLGIILGTEGRTGATIRAVEPGFWEDSGSSAFLEVVAGTAALESDRELLLGRGLAETLELEPGSRVRLMTVRAGKENQSLPRVTIFTVKGIISSGYRELDSLWCIMTYQAGLELLSPELYRSFLTVKIRNPYGGAAEAANRIGFTAGPGYMVYTWMELQQALYRSFESTRQMLLFIMALLVLVAAVSVSSATSMLVIERQRDIAVLKTGGSSPAFIQRIFLWGSFLTGLAGALAGGALGLCIGRFINPIIRKLEGILQFLTSPWGGEVKILDPDYYLEAIPVIIDWRMILLIVVFTLGSAILASIPPARRAGKLKPLDILRRV
ncbi:MAG: FtsX-like permease family protein [Spirochaetaceae bacterium]|jgi:lipoprotein-releasing system permease protein|nr:FtsX-like permease family protein [Spirochaetaceae bacterium]